MLSATPECRSASIARHMGATRRAAWAKRSVACGLVKHFGSSILVFTGTGKMPAYRLIYASASNFSWYSCAWKASTRSCVSHTKQLHGSRNNTDRALMRLQTWPQSLQAHLLSAWETRKASARSIRDRPAQPYIQTYIPNQKSKDRSRSCRRRFRSWKKKLVTTMRTTGGTASPGDQQHSQVDRKRVRRRLSCLTGPRTSFAHCFWDSMSNKAWQQNHPPSSKRMENKGIGFRTSKSSTSFHSFSGGHAQSKFRSEKKKSSDGKSGMLKYYSITHDASPDATAASSWLRKQASLKA